MEWLSPVVREILRSIEATGQDLVRYSDAADYDQTGRRFGIAISGDFAPTYWIDDATGQVKVPDIHASDR